MVRTMAMRTFHRRIRDELAAQINNGTLAPGDRLPSERDLQAKFEVSRSVIRQALAGLARDGLVVSAYPRGYLVTGPRIPWLSRLRVRLDEPWEIEIIEVADDQATGEIKDALVVDEGAPVIVRRSRLRSGTTGELWGLGEVAYPVERVVPHGEKILRSASEITYEDLEAAFDRRIVGYFERMRARETTTVEAEQFGEQTVVLEVLRMTRTTTEPISAFRFGGRSDVFESYVPIET